MFPLNHRFDRHREHWNGHTVGSVVLQESNLVVRRQLFVLMPPMLLLFKSLVFLRLLFFVISLKKVIFIKKINSLNLFILFIFARFICLAFLRRIR